MSKIKYYLLLKKLSTNFFLDLYDFQVFKNFLKINPMNLNETKKDLNHEIKKVLEKSNLKVLTNENDFLVKNLKKPGCFTRT